MNTFIWILSISLLLGCFYEAHLFRRGTLCRQEAWLRATEGRTRSLIIGAKASEVVSLSVCEGKVLRLQHDIKLHFHNKLHRFEVHPQGHL